ncbi:EboA domain-containing protein [Streptomyces sp. B-S-A8]|uniref:EboA domain-containing protein n=1 Tax=Streptomyces solicavernae TaxID=3043614 RepID=A0ABT6RZK9_9ACTN|nr:EboA domain-containing protein [Streptomyces sp. B-S-A8]MDI3389863.1 EboA domain-containing protein [Streptomyces sp. B-S-A8]
MLTTHEELRTCLSTKANAWLDSALADADDAARQGPNGPSGRDIPRWELRFAAAGRECGDPQAAQAVRVLLLHTARPNPADVARLYARGTGDERRAVVAALPYLPLTPAEGVPLIEDALRSNDVRLIAAAVGPYAAVLDAHAWRHAVLKCLFTGVPPAAVAGLADRALGDAELGRMLRDFAAERTAAGRPVPDGLTHVLALTAKGA